MSQFVSFAVVALFLTVGGSAQKNEENRARAPVVDHSRFDRILKAAVHDGSVDYLGIRKHHRQALRGYVAAMARVDIRSQSRAAKLAYYINVYNATMIDAILDRLVKGYSTSDDDHRVFEEPLVRLSGKRVSLNDLENKIIRPEFREPKIHVALVCGARSCPPLLPRAYLPEDLDDVLESNMRRFVNDPKRNRVEGKGRSKKILLSRIFDWYSVDFGGAKGVLGYVQKYRDDDISGLAIEYVEYSWELNSHPPTGRWASLSKPIAGLPTGSIVEVLKSRGVSVDVRDSNGKTHSVPKSGLEAYR